MNVGCIPKKMMHTAALLGEARKDQEAFGWPKFEGKHSWSKMVQGINAKIQSMNRGYESQLKSKLVDYYNALGSFVDKHTISVRHHPHHHHHHHNNIHKNTHTHRSRTVTEKKRPRQRDSLLLLLVEDRHSCTVRVRSMPSHRTIFSGDRRVLERHCVWVRPTSRWNVRDFSRVSDLTRL